MIARFLAPLSWMNRDARLITLARGIRTFSQGFISVIIAIYLAELGFSLVQIGAILTVGVAGVSFFALVVGVVSERVGRRRLLVIFSLLAAAAGLAMYFADAFIPLLVIAFLGSMSTGGGGGESPAQPLEVAILPDTGPAERRTDIFAIYSIVARTGTFLGALAAGLPVVLQDSIGLSDLASYKAMFLGFALCQLAGAALYGFVSSEVEGRAATRQQWQNPLKLPSRRRIFTLISLYSLDTFTTSMVMQSLVAYWFYTKFGLAVESLALVFSLSHLLTASSLWISAKIANKIGLLNTMVFTHIPSSFFLLAAAFAPTAPLAIVFWQCRAFLSQMDVPTRDSYNMAVINAEERVAMASTNMVARSAAGAVGPSVTTAIWNITAAWVPLVGSAVLKISYDLSLYFMFRNVRPPEEEERLRRRRQAEGPAAPEQGKQGLSD